VTTKEIKKIEKMVKELEELASRNVVDDERCHGLEKKIQKKALKFISEECLYPASVATVARRTSKIEFSRWFA
jgi:hypothetical protein